MARIPLIGMGAICCAGTGVEAGYRAMVEGVDGLTPLSLFDSGLKQAPLCGEIKKETGALYHHQPSANRTLALALTVAQEALGPFSDRRGLRLGLVFGTTVGGITRSERFLQGLKNDPLSIEKAAEELAFHEPSALAGALARETGAAFFHTISTACSTSLHIIGMAQRLISDDFCDLCLALGADALSILTIRGFSSLMLIDAAGCKPFDKRRVGASLGEGAAAMLLASTDAARELHATPRGFVCGWGASADCHHMTAPHPEGAGAVRAMSGALAEAGIGPERIDMIAAHGTATPDNDIAEVKAMRALFGAVPPFFACKRTLGHTLAAAGILEAVFALRALNENRVPSTAGFEQQDELIGMSPSPPQNRRMRYLLKNSFGFGGNNGSIVFLNADSCADNA